MVKRLVDVVAGTVLAIVVLPIIVVLAIACAVMFRSWPFFVQERVGRDGRRFRLFKLRTMPPWAPSHAHKFDIQEVPLPRLRPAAAQHPPGRVPATPAGPIRGDEPGRAPAGNGLSAREWRPGFRSDAHVGPPGCTGIWQVSEASSGLIWDAPEYDLFYVKHACLRLDLWILGQTVLGLIPSAEQSVASTTCPRWAVGRPEPIAACRHSGSDAALDCGWPDRRER